MKITKISYYDGARERVCRLAMSELFLEVQDVILNTRVLLLEEKDKNGAGALRKMIDASFEELDGWEKIVTGGIDWKKRYRYNETLAVTLGVEVQVSARSDLIARDVIHLRNAIQQGEVDAGIIITPSDEMSYFLTDRTPAFSDAVRYIEEEFPEARNYPIIIIGLEHDGEGPALKKQRTRQGKK